MLITKKPLKVEPKLKFAKFGAKPVSAQAKPVPKKSAKKTKKSKTAFYAKKAATALVKGE